MKRLLSQILVSILVAVQQLALVAAPIHEYKAYSQKPSHAALKWAEDQLVRMSIDEKIGQMFSIGLNAGFINRDGEDFRELRRQIEENHIGGITLFRSPVYESVVLINRLQALAKYPLLISADLEAGAGMRFDDTINLPWNMAVAATGVLSLAKRQGEITAIEARALGVEQIYAPVVDINNNAGNPVINVRSYGEDPNQVARFAAAFIEGTQSKGVIATAKHFPGHGDTDLDSHRALPIINVDKERLNNIELVPFRASIRAGVGAVMTGHIALPQIDRTPVTPLAADQATDQKSKSVYASEEIVAQNGTTPASTMPASMSPVIGQLLQEELKFDGLVVTDAMNMNGLTIYFTQGEGAVRAVLAGADVLLKPSDVDAAIRGLRDGVASGRVSEQRIDRSVKKILAAKYDLGLVKNRLTSIEDIDRIVNGRETVELSREIAERAITLVRSDANLFPLSISQTASHILNLAITNGDDRFTVPRSFVGEMQNLGMKMQTIALDGRSSETEVREAIDTATKSDLI
ncbi:MAG: glycoside hydrolase family 3 protein, partial [Pyrinomonadaceae bacterium]